MNPESATMVRRVEDSEFSEIITPKSSAGPSKDSASGGWELPGAVRLRLRLPRGSSIRLTRMPIPGKSYMITPSRKLRAGLR
jgi:hypothetical protein